VYAKSYKNAAPGPEFSMEKAYFIDLEKDIMAL